MQMTNSSPLKQRYQDVQGRIADAAQRSGRRPSDVHLVAVTKYAQPEQIRELIEMGHADFGESRVQNLAKRVASIDEFMARHRTLTSSRRVTLPERVRWHMIGHLQRNKVKKAVGLVALVHSVDTLRLAEEIQEAALNTDHPVDVLLQINASFEDTKFGCAIAAVGPLAELIHSMSGLRMRGLMCMGPRTDDEVSIRACFERCADLFEDLRKTGRCGEAFNVLSMGMSSDYEIAIECGANIVRVGSAIFGPRQEHLDQVDEDEDDGTTKDQSSAVRKDHANVQKNNDVVSNQPADEMGTDPPPSSPSPPLADVRESSQIDLPFPEVKVIPSQGQEQGQS